MRWARVWNCWLFSRCKNDRALKLHIEGLKALSYFCLGLLLERYESWKSPFSCAKKVFREISLCSCSLFWGSNSCRRWGRPWACPQPPFLEAGCFLFLLQVATKFWVESESLPLATLQHSWLSEWGFGMSENRRGEGKDVRMTLTVQSRGSPSGRTRTAWLPQTASFS